MSSYYYQERKGFSFAPRNRITYAVQRLILANTVIFAAQLILQITLGVPGLPGGVVVDWLAFHPGWFVQGLVWQPFTYMFLHGGLLHLFFNMLGLYFFGPDVERVLSTRQFFRFYILCGVLGVMASLLPWWVRGTDPSIAGASGATLGVLVAFAVAYPDREIFLFPLPFPINARAVVLLFVVLNLLDGITKGSNVSVSTHLGGMVVGFAYMKFVPRLRDWGDSLRNRRTKRKNKLDALGDAVDNIFKFEDEKRRRK